MRRTLRSGALAFTLAISVSRATGALENSAVDFRFAPEWWQTAICLPDDWQKTLVGKDGCLLYDYPGRYSDFRTRIRFDLETPMEWVSQELASPRVPIVRTKKRAGRVEAIEEAFALPPGRSQPRSRSASIVERIGSATVSANWASPGDPSDPAFRDIAVGWAQPVQYRFRVSRGGEYRVVFGLCEGYHREPGRRVLDLQIDGWTVKRVDPVAERGANKPVLYVFDARDENGDGLIDIAVAAAPGSPDTNTFLNVLWLYPGHAQPDLDALQSTAADPRALAVVRCGTEVAAGSPRTDVLVTTLSNAGSDARELTPALTIDSESAIQAGASSACIRIGAASLFCESPPRHIEKTATGVRLLFDPVRLRAGESRTIAFRIARGEEGPAVDLGRPAGLRASAERYWKSVKLPYDRIEVPDSGIQALLDSSIRNIYQAREIKNGLPAFQVGPTCYRGLWVVDGSFLLEAITFLGRADETRSGVQYLLSFQRPDGAFSLMDGHWKETGIALWAVSRHARLTNDRAWLAGVWPNVQRGFEFIRSMRAQTRQDSNAPTYGLIPEGFSDGGLGGRYPEYTNVYWTLAGMRAAVEAARWLGKEADAASWQAEYDDMMRVFRGAEARDARDDGRGNRFLPIRMRDDEKVAPQKGQWAFLHALFPGQVFAADDPLVKGNLAMLEAVESQGLVFGTGWLSEGIWNYFASFYAHAWLWTGRGDKAAEVLYAFANHASPLLAWREEQMPVGKGGAICGDMPHNWASAEIIRLVRNLLVLERGDELHLLEGLPSSWVRPGARTSLKEVLTEFGPLTLTLSVSEDGRTARLRVKPPSVAPASRIRIHLGAWAAEPGVKELSADRATDTAIPLAAAQH